MKRLEKIFIFPAIIIIIAGFFSGFSERSSIEIAKEILEQRTQILQKAYSGEIEINKAEQYLSKLETYPILTEDVSCMREAQQTDFDSVESMEFLEIKQQEKLLLYRSLLVRIRWHMSGPDSKYIIDNEYSVVLKSTKSGCKLSQFDPK